MENQTNTKKKEMINMENIRELYLRFEFMNNKKVTHEPLYTLDTTPILAGLKEALNKETEGRYPVTKQQIQCLKRYLERDDGLFYFKEGIEVPFRMDNTRYIQICDEVLAHMENDSYYDDTLMTNANILYDWITHLKAEEREIPIICSTKLCPSPNEKLDPIRILRHLSPDGTDEFIILCKEGVTDD